MFQLVLNSIQKTINYVAPPLDQDIEFRYHCELIKDYFSNEQNLEEINSKLIEDTCLPKHLNEIMRLLLEDNERLFVSNRTSKENERKEDLSSAMNTSADASVNNKLMKEENNTSASVEELNPTLSLSHNNQDIQSNTEITISTFIEYLLSNKILEIIINAAKYDLPTGITMHCFKFLAKLLNDYKVNLLYHCSILNQINELISMCAINMCPYEKSQIEFLSIIVNKIKQNYQLIYCFTRNDFPLLNSLISMLASPDMMIADKAGQHLIDLVLIVEDDIVKIVLSRTLFKHKIIENLIYHYKQIPSTIHAEDIETVINLQENQNSLNNELPSLSYQIRKFLTFFKWFSFLDLILLKCKSPILASNLLEVFKFEFLIANLSSNLFLRDEINLQILSTILTFACLKHCKSNQLKESIIDYLLDEKDLMKQLNLNDHLLANHFNQININNQEKQINQEINLSSQDKNKDKALNDKIELNKRKVLIERCKIKLVDNIDCQFLFKLNLNDKKAKDIYNNYLLNLYSLQVI